MALKATIFRVSLQIADMDRHYYQSHQLTLARHPSETDLRMMARVLVFALNAQEGVEFTRGISTDSEPDIWQKNFSGDIEHWLELGEPDLKRIGRACGLARAVSIYPYAERSARIWLDGIKAGLARFRALQICYLPEQQLRQLADLVQRSMDLQITVQDGDIWLADGSTAVVVNPQSWYPA